MSAARDIARSLVNATPLARSLLNATPHRRRRNRRHALERGRDAYTDSASYVDGVFRQHVAVTGARGRVMEIGPGGNVAVAALYVKKGAESAVCLDSMPWIRAHDQLYEELGVSDALDRVQYLSPVTIENAEFDTASFDVIFSQDTLEHVSDPERSVANVARMLKPGGITSHQIDLRDHRNFERPLDFLELGTPRWRLLAAGMVMPPNRWRLSDWEDAFARHGLIVTAVVPNATTVVTSEERGRFARRFRQKSLDDLGVLRVHLVARKP